MKEQLFEEFTKITDHSLEISSRGVKVVDQEKFQSVVHRLAEISAFEAESGKRWRATLNPRGCCGSEFILRPFMSYTWRGAGRCTECIYCSSNESARYGI